MDILYTLECTSLVDILAGQVEEGQVKCTVFDEVDWVIFFIDKPLSMYSSTPRKSVLSKPWKYTCAKLEKKT